MRKVLFISISLIFASHWIFSQDYILNLKNGKNLKKFHISCDSDLEIGIDIKSDTLQYGIQRIIGKVCRIEGNTLLIYPSKELTTLYNKKGGKKLITTDYDEDFNSYMRININDVSYISNIGIINSLKGLEAIIISGALVCVNILNPIISYNYEEKSMNGELWLKLHLYEWGIISQGILVNLLLKPKKYYLKLNRKGKDVWDIVDL